MLSLRGHAPCRSLLKQSPCPSARTSFKPFKAVSSYQQLKRGPHAFAWRPASDIYTCKSQVRCSAQPGVEEHTPEILDELEAPGNLPSAADRSEEEPLSRGGVQQLASLALGGQHKGITTLLGFAAPALAGIAGKP